MVSCKYEYEPEFTNAGCCVTAPGIAGGATAAVCLLTRWSMYSGCFPGIFRLDSSAFKPITLAE